jgi:hypothetical protein
MFCLPGNTVYASHYAYSGKSRLANGAIRQGQICWFLALLREIAPYNPESIARLVKSLPPNRLCTRRPWGDSDLDDFSGPDKFIACAIKHAGDHIVLVAPRIFQPAAEVQAFAKARRVKIARVLPAQLDSRLFARLSLEHIVPAPGAYSAPYDWTEKHVVPV